MRAFKAWAGATAGGLLGMALLFSGACDRRRDTPESKATQTVERGPLKLTVEVGPREIQVGDQIRVDLTVQMPEDYVVQLPTAADLGELPARELPAPDPRPGPSGLVWRRSFLIEPATSGPLEIPAMVVRYGRRSAVQTQPAMHGELVSEPLRLEVKSVLTQTDRPDRPRDITATLSPPTPPLPAWQKCLIAAAALGLLGGLYAAYWTARRRARRPPPPVLPEIWALRALAELAGDEWLKRQRVAEFYYRLTEIVRSYIERKFGLAAPEMTTEEFLSVLARDRRALPYDAERLRAFLEACDIVKYAALCPSREDAERALATARAFVHATAAAGAASSADQAAPRPREAAA